MSLVGATLIFSKVRLVASRKGRIGANDSAQIVLGVSVGQKLGGRRMSRSAVANLLSNDKSDSVLLSIQNGEPGRI